MAQENIGVGKVGLLVFTWVTKLESVYYIQN